MSDTISSVVVDASASPNARLRPVPLAAVRLWDSFWAPRLRINRDVTLPTQYRLLEGTGRIDNLFAAGKHPAEYGRSELDRFVRSGASDRQPVSATLFLLSFCTRACQGRF